MDKIELRITKVFDAPRELVWQMWTVPEYAMKWWGPKGFSAPSIKIDLRVGGQYIFAMQGPAGSEWDKVMYSAGKYLEIVPMEKLVVTDYFSDEEGNMIDAAKYGMDPNFPAENIATVLFEEEAGKTKLTILYNPESEAALEAMIKSQMKEGWESSLEKLAENLIK